jgi:hypothetical protein
MCLIAGHKERAVPTYDQAFSLHDIDDALHDAKIVEYR